MGTESNKRTILDKTTTTTTTYTMTQQLETETNEYSESQDNNDGSQEQEVQGILKNPRRSHILFLSIYFDLISLRRNLPQLFLILFVPSSVYIMSLTYPSWVLAHFLALCFVYGLLDLVDHQQFSSGKKQTSRRVQFQEGTKFWRMPRPISRAQKEEFIRRRFQPPVVRSNNRRGDGPVSQSPEGMEQATERSQPQQQQNVSSSNVYSSCPPEQTQTHSQLIGGDSPMARLRMPPERSLSPSQLIGGDCPMARLRMLRSCTASSQTSSSRDPTDPSATHNSENSPPVDSPVKGPYNNIMTFDPSRLAATRGNFSIKRLRMRSSNLPPHVADKRDK